MIENGLGYDDFADKIVNTLSQKPRVVRAGDVVGLQTGATREFVITSPSVGRRSFADTAPNSRAFDVLTTVQ